MRFKLLILLICSFLFYGKANAQGQANNWYFGENAGLNFNSGSPVALNDGELSSPEGSAVISDASGNLLFYTDGATVWNRNHDTLQNGFGLLGELSSTQAALIIPKPGSSHIYYIFTTSQAQRLANWNFCYSEVDMNLDGGLGGVTANKNIILFQPIGEKITAVKHSNNTDIWVITHAKFTNQYLTFAVTTSGVNITPIIFSGGTIDNGVGDGYASPNWGYMKASPDGSKIAAAFFVVNKTDVLDFNKTTGQLSLSFTINQVVSPYGVEFSPNSSLLYISSYSNSELRQYNLDLSTPAAIISNSVNIPSVNGTFALQLGPDEKIYIACAGQTSLDCIQAPNQIGLNCNILSSAVSLNGAFCILGLPNFAPYLFIPSGIEHIGSCPNDTISFTFLNGLQADSVLWNFDDPNSGALNTSNSLTPFHIYQSPGTYIVSVTTFQGSVVNTVDKPVTILPIPDISIGDDITFCTGATGAFFMLNTQNGFSYNWFVEYPQFPFTNLQHPFTSLAVVNTGIYYASASNICGISIDTANAIREDPISNFTLGPDFSICEGNPIFLAPSNQGNGNYLWQDGSTQPFLSVSQTGNYSVQIANSCGALSDTILVTIIPLPVVSLGSDTIMCAGDSIQLNALGSADTFVWQDGSQTTTFDATIGGTYYINAINNCGLTSDTIHITQITAPVNPDFGVGLSFCEGTSIILNAVQADVSYVWQDGSTNPEFTVTQAGTYAVVVSNQCGIAADTTFVIENPLPTVSLGTDTTICLGDSIQLNANGIADTYLWQDGSSNPQFTASQSGIYYVEASNNCGFESDSINISVNPLPSVSLGQDISNCNGSAVQLNATGIADTYLWQDGSNLQTLTTNISGSYFVIVSNSCGTSSDTILVSINSPSTSFINKNECAPFSLNGITYNTSGQFIQVLQNANGCDSVLTINVSIANLNAQILQADSTLYLNSNPATIQWINCDNKALIAGANQATFVPQFTGSYAAIIADGICLDTSNCILVIKALPEPSPKLLCQGLTIFPNPINDKIEFILDKAFYPITIYTSTGALLKSSIGSQQKQTIFLENLAPAMYILQIDECRYKVIKN